MWDLYGRVRDVADASVEYFVRRPLLSGSFIPTTIDQFSPL